MFDDDRRFCRATGEATTLSGASVDVSATDDVALSRLWLLLRGVAVALDRLPELGVRRGEADPAAAAAASEPGGGGGALDNTRPLRTPRVGLRRCAAGADWMRWGDPPEVLECEEAEPEADGLLVVVEAGAARRVGEADFGARWLGPDAVRTVFLAGDALPEEAAVVQAAVVCCGGTFGGCRGAAPGFAAGGSASAVTCSCAGASAPADCPEPSGDCEVNEPSRRRWLMGTERGCEDVR